MILVLQNVAAPEENQMRGKPLYEGDIPHQLYIQGNEAKVQISHLVLFGNHKCFQPWIGRTGHTEAQDAKSQTRCSIIPMCYLYIYIYARHIYI